MAVTVRIMFSVLIIYLGCDHCGDCRPEGKSKAGRSSINRYLDQTEMNDVLQINDYFNNGGPVCGRRYVVNGELRREVKGDNSTDDIDDDSDMDKILGGGFATYGEFPWIANILYDNVHLCGGSIISEFWVITAAHCLDSGIKELYSIAVGDHTLWKLDTHETKYNVDSVFLQGRYHPGSFDYDIGLIKVKPDRNGRGIKFNAYVQPSCLPLDSRILAVNTQMVIAGWGNTAQSGNQSVILKKVRVPLMWHSECITSHPKVITPNMFCVGTIGHSVANGTACHGDSGGPAFSQTPDGVVLYGIISFGNGCRDTKEATVLINVSRFRAWIVSTIKANSKGIQAFMPIRRNPF
ncbi:unnamed protein product [Candidula unifasciata]|uniref:Peptidase S1 domain-containing protein n=1 Tax=Candidula unifasciata TaxID=100452 RepID=A0A8S3Z7C8_9EUPU|nr:unnamed protein product [Candidula unifasciata]